MHFDVEIYFSGLCFFEFRGDDPRCAPDCCTVLLVDADRRYPYADELGERTPGRHRPRMIIPAKNFIVSAQDAPCFPITVSEDGEDLVFVDLRTRCVDLRPTCGYGSPLYVPRHRERGRFSTPDDSGGSAEWYDWIALLREIEPELGPLKDYHCFGGASSSVLSCVNFAQGDLENLEVARRREDNVIFEFRTVCGQPVRIRGNEPRLRERCLSDRIVLRFRDLERPLMVTVTERSGERWVFGIGASQHQRRGNRPVAASITNLDKYLHPAPRAVFDFLWFYELFEWNCGPKDIEDRIIPWPTVSQHSGRAPSAANCPPGGS